MFQNKKIIQKKKAWIVEITFYSEEKPKVEAYQIRSNFGYNIEDIKVTYTEAAIEKSLYPQTHEEITKEWLEDKNKDK